MYHGPSLAFAGSQSPPGRAPAGGYLLDSDVLAGYDVHGDVADEIRV